MTEGASALPYQLKQFKYNSHYWILKLIDEARRPLRILDVGTAGGYLGAVLKQRGHFLVGIERDAPLARQARSHYDEFHLADIETFEFPYREEFDFVLFADVLEHLREPAAVLRRALPCLKNNGEVIVSVPNIANVVIRLELLLGRFEYSDRGILDRTHLRFFTLASLRRMLRDCGCAVLQTRVTPVPVQLVVPITDGKLFSPLHEVHYALVRLWKSMFAYQFVMSAAVRSR
jgi:2-polyprenyl-3-methyl-5-hydroxy-6-metoxy-1,4-benzoquinol methylase